MTRSEDTEQRSSLYVDLDLVEGLPIMPTLSGWLLQYPVVYLADCHTAERLARLLSDSVLNLYGLHVTGAWMQVTPVNGFMLMAHERLEGSCAFALRRSFM